MSKLPPQNELRLLLISSLAVSALSYVTNFFLANSMGSEGFGQYTYALVLGVLLGQLVAFGSVETGMRLKVNYGDDALDWILAARVLNFFVVVIGAFAVFLVSFDITVLLALIVTLNALSFATHYEARGRNVRYAYVFFVERILIACSIWIGLLFLDNSLMGWVFTALALFQSISLVFQYLENRTAKRDIKWVEVLNVYKEGLFVLIFSLAKFSFGGGVRIIIYNQLGEERMGVFAAAWQFIPLSTLYFAQITKVWRLRITISLSERDGNEFWRHLKAMLCYTLIPCFLAAAVFWLFGGSMTGLILSSDYRDVSLLMPYIGAYFLIVGFDSVIVLLAIANNRAMLACAVYSAFGAITILACIFLAKNYGLEGYIVTILLGHCCATITLGAALSFSSARRLR